MPISTRYEIIWPFSVNAKIDELIYEIGNLIVHAADINFDRAWLYIEAEEGAIAPDLFYRTIDNQYVYRFADLDLVNKVYELYKEFQSPGKPPWTTFSCTLGQDNKFSIDFGYDNVFDDGSTRSDRKTAWIRKYLGDVKLIYPQSE